MAFLGGEIIVYRRTVIFIQHSFLPSIGVMINKKCRKVSIGKGTCLHIDGAAGRYIQAAADIAVAIKFE